LVGGTGGALIIGKISGIGGGALVGAGGVGGDLISAVGKLVLTLATTFETAGATAGTFVVTDSGVFVRGGGKFVPTFVPMMMSDGVTVGGGS